MVNWNKIKKAAGILVMAVLIVSVLLMVATSMLNRTRNRPTFFFHYSLLWVETGSMEPTIPQRSYILVKKADGVPIEEGSIITFVCSDPSSAVYGRLITHRVTQITPEGYKTKGDQSNPDTWIVLEQDIIAVHIRNLPVMTVCGRIFASPVGLVLIIAVFLSLWVFFYIPDLINALKDDRRAELEKEKLIAQRVQEEVEKLRQQDRKEVEK